MGETVGKMVRKRQKGRGVGGDTELVRDSGKERQKEKQRKGTEGKATGIQREKYRKGDREKWRAGVQFTFTHPQDKPLSH
jgi:hypothetical protein